MVEYIYIYGEVKIIGWKAINKERERERERMLVLIR